MRVVEPSSCRHTQARKTTSTGPAPCSTQTGRGRRPRGGTRRMCRMRLWPPTPPCLPRGARVRIRLRRFVPKALPDGAVAPGRDGAAPRSGTFFRRAGNPRRGSQVHQAALARIAPERLVTGAECMAKSRLHEDLTVSPCRGNRRQARRAERREAPVSPAAGTHRQTICHELRRDRATRRSGERRRRQSGALLPRSAPARVEYLK